MSSFAWCLRSYHAVSDHECLESYCLLSRCHTGKVVGANLEHNVYHYLTEAAKFAASYRMNIGDPDFNSTANVVRVH